MEDLEFTIKNKPISFKFAILLTVASVGLGLMMILIIIACRIYVKAPYIWFIEVIPAVALGLSVFWLFTYYKEEFSLKEDEFRYVKVFKKDIIIYVETISCVYLRPFGQKTKVEFMNKQGEIEATIFDNGTIFQDGIFLDALEKLNIEVKRNGYGDE